MKTDPYTVQSLTRDLKRAGKALGEMLLQCEGTCGWASDDDPVGRRRNERKLAKWHRVYVETAP